MFLVRYALVRDYHILLAMTDLFRGCGRQYLPFQ